MGRVCLCQGTVEIGGRLGLTMGLIFGLGGRKELWETVGWAVG